MKQILLFTILLFSRTVIFGQLEKDPTILKYIESKGNFMPVSESSKIPYVYKPYYGMILTHMNVHEMIVDDYYFDISGITFTDTTLSVPIFHYDGFVKEWELNQYNTKANEDRDDGKPYTFIDINGNMSGWDGAFEIDTRGKRVIGFFLWC